MTDIADQLDGGRFPDWANALAACREGAAEIRRLREKVAINDKHEERRVAENRVLRETLESYQCVAGVNAHLLSENGALRERLRSLEWAATDTGEAVCPVCDGPRPHPAPPPGYQEGRGHDADCWLAAEIGDCSRTARGPESDDGGNER